MSQAISSMSMSVALLEQLCVLPKVCDIKNGPLNNGLQTFSMLAKIFGFPRLKFRSPQSYPYPWQGVVRLPLLALLPPLIALVLTFLGLALN